MDYRLQNIINHDMPTKQKILICSLDLFCKKGYSETSIRDISSAVGITPGSIYGHFSSKDEILRCMLNDYAEYTKDMFHTVDIVPILKRKPTGEGISLCVMSSISILTESVYYGNLVHLIHQEQHRNASFGGYVLVRLQDSIEFVKKVFRVLKEMNVIRADADADAEYWGFFTYSVLYLVPTCESIKNTRNFQMYSIKDLASLLRYLFDAMLNTYKIKEETEESI